MEFLKKIIKNKSFFFVSFIISEMICFYIIRTNVILYKNDHIYSFGIDIVQFLYFLPVFICGLYLFFFTTSNRKKLIYSTLGLIFYSIFLHIFIREIAILFTSANGIVNFVEYAFKIYFICLPLVGFSISLMKQQNTKISYFLLFMRIFLLFIIVTVFSNLFDLKGVLYSWPLIELISLSIFFMEHKKLKLKK